MSQYFPKSCKHSGGNVTVELDISNYLTKANLKGVISIGTFMLASKTDSGSLKTKVDNF